MNKKILASVLVGFLLGTLWLIALRFVTYKSENVHHHANFALYIDGQLDTFDNFTFYEEVQSCGSDEVNNPKTRVHMHDKVAHVVHVHNPASTWGHFFANLGYTLGDDVIKTDKGVHVDGQDGNKLLFYLNGEEVMGIANVAVHSEDVLLISYGQNDENILKQRYDEITKDADEYNKRDDPSSCTGSKKLTFNERLKKAIGF